jgi:hypothetical protein
MITPGPNPLRRHLIALATLGAIVLTAPWPGIQAIFHVFLVLGVAPDFPSPIPGALWALAAGWTVEGTLRIYPHMGGTPLADMILCLASYGFLIQWPPHSRNPFWGRMAAFAIAHYLLTNLLVRFAGGPHAWGFAWIWTVAAIPLWATLALRLHAPIHRR